MRVATVREVKSGEHRVGLTPRGVTALVARGHEVLVENEAGVGTGFSDQVYAQAGARLVSREEAWGEAELLVKVKEPIDDELGHLREDLVLFAYLHLAAAPRLTAALVSRGTTALAYETVSVDGRLPLLEPMSEIAGRLAVQQAARLLEVSSGGPGILLSSVAGTAPARVVVIGGGTVGLNAARTALALGASVRVFDVSVRDFVAPRRISARGLRPSCPIRRRWPRPPAPPTSSWAPSSYPELARRRWSAERWCARCLTAPW